MTESSLTPLLSEKLAARFLAVSQRTLQAWRMSGVGPDFVKMGRAVRYLQSDLENWISSKRARTDSHTRR